MFIFVCQGFIIKFMAISPRAVRKREELQHRILAEARDIVVTEGFQALSMRKLAERADCALGTLYLYFKNRDDIARHLWTEGFSQLVEAMSPSAAIADPSDRMRSIANAYIEFGLNHSATYRLLFMEDPKFSDGTTYTQGFPEGTVDPGTQALGLLLGLVSDLKAAGLVPESANDFQLTETFWTGLHGIISLRITCSLFLQTEPKQLAAGLVDSLLRGWKFGAKKIDT